MRWLVLLPPELKNNNSPINDIQLIEQILKKHDACFTIFDKDVRVSNSIKVQFLSAAARCTHCIVLRNYHSEQEVTNNFCIGYLCGRNIPVFAEKEFALDAKDIFPNFRWFNSAEELAAEVDEKYEVYAKEALRVYSLNKLLSAGIPFTANAFASYIEKTDCTVCKLFLTAQMNLNSRDNSGTPMVNIACRAEKLECVKWLIENGADVNCISEDRGYSPVMDSVWKKNMAITKYLIEQHADLGFISKEGQSILVLAVGIGNPKMCRLLVENGADPDVKDAMGMSAYEYAKLFKKQEIIDSLEPYHKK